MLARPPTSHERASGQSWDASYRDGPAPWDLGRPQAAIARLADEGKFTGAVLDAGCGPGDNALLIASLGLTVLGVDVAETALALARDKAAARNVPAEFLLADVFQLDRLGRTFDTILDSGLFHTFDGDEEPRYVASLAAVAAPNATLFLLCFADRGHGLGPHPVSEARLRAAFQPASGWRITGLAPDRIETRLHDHGAPAWLAQIERI